MAKKNLKAIEYEFDGIVEEVDAGLDAATARLEAGGMRARSIGSRDVTKFKKMLSQIMDVAAWSVDEKAIKVRWNRRAIKLIAEVIGAGFIARKHYKEPAMTADEITDHVRYLGKLVNSVTHNG